MQWLQLLTARGFKKAQALTIVKMRAVVDCLGAFPLSTIPTTIMSSISLTPVPAHLIAIGKALPRSIYSAAGELLLAKGFIVVTNEQLAILNSGYFRSTDGGSGGSAANTGAPATKSIEQPAATETNNTQSEQVMMDEVRWQVGETFFLHQQGASVRYTARFIGYVKNRTVLVTMPIVDDKYVLIRDGQMFVVRAFSGKKAYAFSAFVVKSMHSPHPYLHLSYPKQLSCATIRHRARIPVNVIAAVLLDGQEDTAAAVINDMSLGGASASIKHPFGETGQRGRIKFKINAVGETVYMDVCTILRSIVPVENGGGCKHGYEFVDLSTQDRLVLSAYFHQAEVERN